MVRPIVKNKKNKVSVTAKLDPDHVSRLDQKAEDMGTSRSYLIQKAVKDMLTADEQTKRKPAKKG